MTLTPAERQSRYRVRHPDRDKIYKMNNSAAIKISSIKYRVENLARERLRGKEIYQNRRSRIFEFFGCACAKCGFDNPRALQIDHILGGGRRELKGKEASAFVISVINADPNEARRRYQILCANCNVIKRIDNGEHAPPRKYGVTPQLTTASTITED